MVENAMVRTENMSFLPSPIFCSPGDTTRSTLMLAPLAAIDAVEAATMLSFNDGLAEEARLFQKCLFSDQSKAMIHVFFAEREVGKIPDVPKDTPVLPVKSVGIVGAGTMGGGITMNFLNAGIPVLLKEVDQDALDRGLGNIMVLVRVVPHHVLQQRGRLLLGEGRDRLRVAQVVEVAGDKLPRSVEAVQGPLVRGVGAE